MAQALGLSRARRGASFGPADGPHLAATSSSAEEQIAAIGLEDGIVYHAYSTYARGLDGLWGMYQWLDRAPKGRNETGMWWRRHDEYAKG